jgi:uncharacterized alkaline shock family protein YloU
MSDRYIETTTNLSQAGKTCLSTSSFVQIAYAVLIEMPNVATDPKEKVSAQSGLNVRLSHDISCRIQNGKPVVSIRIQVRKDENAASLAQEIQEEVSNQILSLTEIPSCQVNVKIDGII